jgi:hypothetical protein
MSEIDDLIAAFKDEGSTIIIHKRDKDNYTLSKEVTDLKAQVKKLIIQVLKREVLLKNVKKNLKEVKSNSKNNSAVRKGFELSGSLMHYKMDRCDGIEILNGIHDLDKVKNNG